MARATKEQLENRKENALALLDSHADSYRVWYAKISGVTKPTPAELAEMKAERQLMDIKGDAIHTQIKLLDELLETYNVEEITKTAV